MNALPFRWPWSKPAAPEVDVQAVAREAGLAAGKEAATLATEEFRRLLTDSPLGAIPDPRTPPPVPVYAWDNPIWYSIPQSPKRRPGALVTVETLRRMADSYDVLRSCIQHLKREISAVPVEVVARAGVEITDTVNRAVAAADQFFGMDGGLGGAGCRRSHFESELVEDLCVVGAAATYFAPTRGGGIYEVLPIDASTIRPKVDAYGWPGPGEAAYEQWIYGIRTRDYTREELRYDGIYPVSYSPYFKSPLEWLINVANAALRSDQWNLSWLTDGTTPADTIALPEHFTPEQIIQFAAFDKAQREGDSGARARTRWVPGGSQHLSSLGRKDQDFAGFDIWLLRRTCAIYGVQPASIGFAGEQYKVSQEESMDSTSAFGVGVLLDFRKATYDDILCRLGYSFLECRNVVSREEDPEKRATRNEKLVKAGIKLVNEARADEGLDPIEGGDVPLVPNTLVPLAQLLQEPGSPADKTSGNIPGDDEANREEAEEPPGQDEERADLARWERKALNRLKAGKSAVCAFESAAIPAERAEWIRQRLGGCSDVAAVRDLFFALGDKA